MHFFVRVLIPVGLFGASSYAWAETPLNADLWIPLGVTSALQGGGRAHVSDFSAADNNPAGIDLQKTFSYNGELGWTAQKARQAEGAICDSMLSEVSACVKYRQTSAITGAKDWRATLGLADSFEQLGGAVLGAAVDYVKFAKVRGFDAISAPSPGVGQRVRVGAVYPLAGGLFFGASSDGLYDSTGTQAQHGIGLSLQGGKHFLFSGDLNFVSDTPRDVVFGATVFPRDFLDLAISYSYDPRQSKHKTAGGIVVKSQQARLLYSVAQAEGKTYKWVQRIGIGIFTTGDAGAR